MRDDVNESRIVAQLICIFFLQMTDLVIQNEMIWNELKQNDIAALCDALTLVLISRKSSLPEGASSKQNCTNKFSQCLFQAAVVIFCLTFSIGKMRLCFQV